MPRVYPARAVLAQRIRERRLTLEEFSEQLELFARENNEVGTVSIRHVQRLAAGQCTSDQLRPATARLLERYFGSPIEELLVSSENKDLSAQGSDLLAQTEQPDCAASALELRAGAVASLYRRDSLKHSVVFSALGFDELRHLRAAFDDARRYLDIEVVGYFKKQLNSCAANDGAHGPAHALPPALGIVAAIEIHAREVKADVRRELLTVGAQAAEFVGWLYRDARQPRLSGHWRDRAMEWAQEAGDLPMQGYLLLKKSQAA